MQQVVIIAARGDVEIYRTREDAERDLEAIDVRNGEYVGYDSTGGVLRLGTEGDAVRISTSDQDAPRAAELQEILIQFLSATGTSSEWLSAASLDDLVSTALQKHAYKEVGPSDFFRDLLAEGISLIRAGLRRRDR